MVGKTSPNSHDRRRVLAAAFLRSLATGTIGVSLGLFLARHGLGASEIGLVVGAGLAGAAVASLLVTLAAPHLDPRRSQLALAILGAAAGMALATVPDARVAALVAFLGMVNGMGRDRGAGLILDQALLADATPDAERTRAFAWYAALQDAGHALGALLAGLPGAAAILVYAALTAATFIPYAGLAKRPPHACPSSRTPVSLESRRILWRISTLFAVDSVAGGFLTSALLAYFFHERFGASAAAVGVLFFGARALNAVSHFGAAWLARRIGLVRTMVFTHVPSSLLLATVPFAPSYPVAAALFLLREGLVEMDVPTRQSYVMAVVRPHERTRAAGVTHLVRLGGWAAAPFLAGSLMSSGVLAAPILAGAGLKIAYDVLLYAAFRHHRPPEERGPRATSAR